MTTTAPILAPELARAVAAQGDRLDRDLLARAYRVSAQAHRGQKRLSGDDFVSHSVAVATILAEQQMDSTTIAAALLHDVVEDSDVSLDDIRRDFGPEVAELVDAGRLLDLPVYDHVIVGGERFVSFAEAGLL